MKLSADPAGGVVDIHALPLDNPSVAVRDCSFFLLVILVLAQRWCCWVVTSVMESQVWQASRPEVATRCGGRIAALPPPTSRARYASLSMKRMTLQQRTNRPAQFAVYSGGRQCAMDGAPVRLAGETDQLVGKICQTRLLTTATRR